MTEEKYTEISPAKRFVCNLVMASGLVLCGIVLLIIGVTSGITGLDVVVLIAPVILLTLGVVLLITALVQCNTVSLYLSVLFLVCSVASFLANLVAEISYGTIWPIYVAAPAIASFFTMLMSKDFSFHLKVILLFGVPAVFLALFTGGVWGVHILIPALIIYIGLLGLFAALSIKGAKENE